MSREGKASWGELRLAAGGMTHAEIAQRLGISPERVRQLERRALSKCRRKFSAMGFNLGEEVADGGKATDVL